MIRLKVQMDSPAGIGARVWLGDCEISHGLKGLDVSFNVGEANVATLKMAIDGLDIDAPTLAVLQAHVKGKQAAAATEPDMPTFAPDEEPCHAA